MLYIISNEFFQPFFTRSNYMYFTDLSGNLFTLKNGKIELFKSVDIDKFDLNEWQSPLE